MNNINPTTQEPITPRQIRALHPNTTIGPNADLVALGYPEIEPVARPEPDPGYRVVQGPPEEYAPGQWRQTWTQEAVTPSVPPSISKRQCLLRLYDEGLTEESITLILEGIEDPIERDKALIQWKHTTGVDRNEALAAHVQQDQGGSDAYLDQLFIEASQL